MRQFDSLSQLCILRTLPEKEGLREESAGSGFSGGSHLPDLEYLYVFCLEALGTPFYRKFYCLTLLQTAKSI